MTGQIIKEYEDGKIQTMTIEYYTTNEDETDLFRLTIFDNYENDVKMILTRRDFEMLNVMIEDAEDVCLIKKLEKFRKELDEKIKEMKE